MQKKFSLQSDYQLVFHQATSFCLGILLVTAFSVAHMNYGYGSSTFIQVLGTVFIFD